jgi:adenylylsulfate kinase
MKDKVYPHVFQVNRAERNKMNGHASFVVWFTGLSGSGKSTLANLLEIELVKQGIHVYVLDGDNLRNGINSDLGFSESDRLENIRRVAHISKLLIDAGSVCLASFIAPTEDIRSTVNAILGDDVIHVFVNTPIEICEARDVKGLYAKARNGELLNFTGVNAPFEIPKNADLTIDTSKEEISLSVERLATFIRPRLALK